jgi:hypothetical protein
VKQDRERRALLLGDMDEAPGVKLAMIRRAAGDGEDAPQFLRARPRFDKVARPAGTAGLEQGERR